MDTATCPSCGGHSYDSLSGGTLYAHIKSCIAWEVFVFPQWVPDKVKKMISEFWSPDCGRGPDQWADGARGTYNRQPEIGTVVTVKDWYSKRLYQGRWLPTWNNMGVIVLDNGIFKCFSTCDIIETPEFLK